MDSNCELEDSKLEVSAEHQDSCEKTVGGECEQGYLNLSSTLRCTKKLQTNIGAFNSAKQKHDDNEHSVDSIKEHDIYHL